MVRWYVDSNATGGDNTGVSAANAWLTLSQAVAVAAGDDIAVAHNHSENSGSGITYNFTNGTRSNPVLIISRNLTDDSIQDGATLTSGSGAPIEILGNVYIQGLTISAGDDVLLGTDAVWESQVYMDCTFSHNATTAGRLMRAGPSSIFSEHGKHIEFIGCTWNPEVSGMEWGVNSFIRCWDCTFNLETDTEFDLSILSGTCLILEACNLAGDATPTTLFAFDATQHIGFVYVRFCNLPSDTITTSDEDGPAYQVLLIENSDSGTITEPPLGLTYFENAYGVVQKETGHYVNSGGLGSTDNERTNPYSWNCIASTHGIFTSPFVIPPLAVWVDGGSEITLTVEHASFPAVNDDDVWIEWFTNDTTAAPNAKALNDWDGSDRMADPNATPASHESTSAGWAGGMLVGSRGKSSKTFTPTNAGWVYAIPHFGLPNQQIFLNPKINVS